MSKAYSGKTMAIAISDEYKVSVDVEEAICRSAEALDYYLDKFRSFRIMCCETKLSQETFYKCWTAMESFFKFKGQGFHSDKDFELDIDNEMVVKNDKVLAHITYLQLKNSLIALCTAKKIAKEQVNVICKGWDEKL
jgi:phosphopantetheinyl transferase